jgi:hypothetical protein
VFTRGWIRSEDRARAVRLRDGQRGGSARFSAAVTAFPERATGMVEGAGIESGSNPYSVRPSTNTSVMRESRLNRSETSSLPAVLACLLH